MNLQKYFDTIARGDIFLKSLDFEKFLEIISEAKLRYDFTVHSLCLMNNHYHILIETKRENLSLIARQINSKYAQYFNREYKRVGPLWQGRFKNYYVYDDDYLYILLKYIERNPIKANITKTIGAYKWSTSSFLLLNVYKELMSSSILFDKDMFVLLTSEVTEKEMAQLETLQKTKYIQEDESIRRQKQRSLAEYFYLLSSLKQRNDAIKEAVLDGYKQSEIAEFLQLSPTTVSKVMKT
jgi:REP element-mobilizing transposase RayT/DNA-binding CsgD family transcriptional regulator